MTNISRQLWRRDDPLRYELTLTMGSTFDREALNQFWYTDIPHLVGDFASLSTQFARDIEEILQ